ncbi:metalloregulator ArsR/SmtB family transcription factor [Asanoa sp. WMMD1127]|uniref:ArsR/SmtB family transcription factor n=1 Tax=Asanoa sp. WMMD1127 TaxID=3016107 RepID=UPI0024159D61|nr:metalloregulator ArsR/SmtB family transcription factor [Asanoa sp. WMMD1127]MDG4826098.1 metalloregulator ArsR/SmtB family transcription factor [Asanoa sp. WMMD1127]
MTDREVNLDATLLRGLAHPLRVRILGLLREHGPATATTLAERLGQSTGATSYHLRILANYGFVVDDPERNVGRERWWKAAHRGTRLDINPEMPSADTEGYLRAVANQYADRVVRYLDEMASLPPHWIEPFTISDFPLRLTAAEAKELHEAIFAFAERYRRDDADTPHPEGAERVVLQVQILPFPEPPEEGR